MTLVSKVSTGIRVADGDQRLCGKMDDNIGLSCRIGVFQRSAITQIGDGIGEWRSKPARAKKDGFVGGKGHSQ